MFKLVLLLMIKTSASHTMEVTVGGFDSYEACKAATYTITESYVGWGKAPKLITDPGHNNDRVIEAYCKEED